MHLDFLSTYQAILPASWGLSGIQSVIVVGLIAVVCMHALPLGIALLRGQPEVAQLALRDCMIGTACVLSVLGAWTAIFFFGRALYRSAFWTT